ncbi:putative short chain dehydrogenase reductase [Diaporthe ampelina]|uniref:Putative short chain dehydrogenase reductase n=1 Tax=Diaporthe ampelina TaxID=1214573 RepID=A0A0G2FJT6_9PEZI|nr:putative short chain dehydrogenase reductase [Diaporthe ampelina]
MADTPAYQTVMVTGANAFYSAAIIERLVEKGVKIHAVVRRESAGKPLEKQYGRDKVQVFVAPDLTTPDAFQEAMRGCDAVFHVASPFRYKFSDAAAEVLDPAINCAVAALRAAAAEPRVRRVVLTSSVAACLDPLHPTGFHRPGYTYTEADWNPVGYGQAAGLTAFPPVYTASKALAERAAWDFMAAERRHFDLVCINPCHTWGSYGQSVARAADMNATNSDLSKLMDGEEEEVPRTIMPWMCDISEVAQAHLNALYRPGASGRYIIANHEYDFQQVVDLLHERFGDSDWIQNVPRGTPGKKAIESHFVLDNARSKKELGVEYGDWKQSVIDFCCQYQEDRKRFT